MKKKLFVILILLFAGLAAATAVSADVVSGIGWLEAKGDGAVRMNGYAKNLGIRGNGVLYYRDGGEEDVPEVTGYGRKIDLPNGWVKYEGFHGTFYLEEADQTAVVFYGRSIGLRAVGRGTVWLKGRGVYAYGTPDGTVTGDWSPDGQTFNLHSE